MPNVLILQGKHESVDYAKVKWFEDSISAQEYCDCVNTGKTKYWTKAKIIRDGEEIELCMPEGNY